MSKFEKLVYVGCPWLFGVVMVVTGIMGMRTLSSIWYSLMLICTGFICMSMYCICSLLAKLVDKVK